MAGECDWPKLGVTVAATKVTKRKSSRRRMIRLPFIAGLASSL
jgi:hypothetical protein